MELLAPAGGWEQLQFAICFGADAVYLGTDRFGMRARADNFQLDEMPQVVAYAHERGVKIHVTINTQMYEDDFADLPVYIRALAQAGVDAFIISDLGAFALAKEEAPQVDIHVSTQASISNSQAALTWYKLGAKRIVCAREMSLAAIAEMRQKLPSDLEIEVFAHGSMCMAVSGRCLISDYMTGRSGVAGNCAQPCRWKYALQEETRPGEYYPIEEDESGSYIMNAKDLCMLEHLDKLRDAGIDAIKIEGRNKKAFYVATVVNAYRQVLDGADAAAFMDELDTVSHRPYSTGFYFGPAHQTPEDDRYTRHYQWAFEAIHIEELSDINSATCRSAVQNPAQQDSSCASLLHASKEIASQSNRNSVQTVASSISDNSSTASGSSNCFTVTGLCRNKFEEGDTLEVLSPHQPIRTCTVQNLHYVGVDPDHPGFPPAADVYPGPVQAANRTMELYSFTVPFEVAPHDIFRIRRD
ncbi:MAG: U32 family peptidase [Eggerthellaceae bacterium]|nr:U32 family peptidase [Eggerthellaceae bacterium]